MSLVPKFLRRRARGAKDHRVRPSDPAQAQAPTRSSGTMPGDPEPRISGDEAAALLAAGVAALDSGDLDQARQLFEQLETSGRLMDWAAFRLGLTLRRLDDEPGAKAAFERAIRRSPHLFWAHFERLQLPAVREERSVRDAAADAMLDSEWTDLQSAHVAEIEALSRSIWRDGKRDLAGRLLARLWPSTALSAESLDRIVETALDPDLIEAVEERRTGRRRRADPGSAKLTDDARDQQTFDTAVDHFEKGNLAIAAAALEPLTKSAALGAWAHFYLGRIYAGEADQTRALRAFDAAIAIDPEFFWAHYERVALASTLTIPTAQFAAYVGDLYPLTWEELAEAHVRELERVAHALWDREDREGGARLLSRLWPSPDLGWLGLVRIVEQASNSEIQRLAAERLQSLGDLDNIALRVLSDYRRRRGEGNVEISLLERAFDQRSDDFDAWIGLIRSYAANGERTRAFAAIDQAKAFSAKQREYATLVARVELGDVEDAFLSFRDYCRKHGEVPKYPGIRTAYRLGDLFDVARRDEVIGILSANYPGDRDVALVLINAAMRDQRWGDAQAIFDAHFGDSDDLPQDVRLARIDILAYSGNPEEAARLLEKERVEGGLPRLFLRSTIRILSELERWEEVVDAGLAQLGEDDSLPQFLSVLVRAARKAGASERLFDALLALPRPLKPEQVETIHAVAEDLAELGQDVLDRLDGVELPRERRSRIALKLRRKSGFEPATKDLCIYYCADAAYLTPALVSLTSLALSNISVARRAVFYLVVEDDVLARARAAGAALAHRFDLAIEVIDAAAVVGSTEGLRTTYGLFTGGQQLALAAYYRIFFARWLVEQKRFAQALYVDADTIVRGGLEEVFALDRDAPVMARPDLDRPEVRRATALHKLAGQYFNSGVLRFALDHPELPVLLDRAIAAATNPSVELIFQDQCALNIAFDTRAADLPSRFNAFTPPSVPGDGIPVSDAVIVHFLDRPKPWDSLYRHPAREWFEWFDLVETLLHDGGQAD